MAERTQTYKNHRQMFPLYHYFVAPILLLNLLNALRYLFIDRITRHTIWDVLMAAALVALALSARLMALTVQDRVIRLEMRQRLAMCLSPDLHPRINDLTRRQLVALRFASDAEMNDLVREVLAGKLATDKEIKLRVKNWQADWLRA